MYKSKKDKLKVELVLEINRLKEDRKLTQIELAKIMGISQPRLSNILNLRFDLVSLDYLTDRVEDLENKLKAA